MDETTATISRVVFWVLAGFSALLPMRISLLAYILISHVDVTSSGFDSATSVGFENAVKTVLLPTVLLIRYCRHRLVDLRWNWPMGLWILLTAYAAVSLFWSPFQLPGLKMVGYLYCYLVLCGVLAEGWTRGCLSPGLLALSLWVSLALGVVQTYLLDNPYGRSLPGLNDDRFTSFCAPQLFAAFVLAILSVLIVSRRLSGTARVIHVSGAVAGLMLCGSRYVFLGAIAMLGIVWASYVFRDRSVRGQALRFAGGLAGMVALVAGVAAFFYQDSGNRISQLIAVLARGESAFESMGTLVWRKGIYEQAFQRLASRAPLELTFGSGTSSGASIVLGYDLRYTENHVDANRVVHNEILRALYEWGIVGLLMFLGLLVSLTFYFLRAAVHCRVIPAYAFLSLLPTVILGCFSENILAGSASPAGVGFLLSITYGVSHYQLWMARRRRILYGSAAPPAAARIVDVA